MIFGHSLAENDSHALRCISFGAAANLLLGLYGDPASEANGRAIESAEQLSAASQAKRPNKPLNIIFYDAATAEVGLGWDPSDGANKMAQIGAQQFLEQFAQAVELAAGYVITLREYVPTRRRMAAHRAASVQ